jgi:hypothetical protein
MTFLSKDIGARNGRQAGVMAAVADLHRDRSPPGRYDLPTDALTDCIDRIDIDEIVKVPG